MQLAVNRDQHRAVALVGVGGTANGVNVMPRKEVDDQYIGTISFHEHLQGGLLPRATTLGEGLGIGGIEVLHDA